MKKSSLFLIFLIALCTGILIEGFSSGCFMSYTNSVAYAPRDIPPIDYSGNTVYTGGKININTASVSQLSILEGIGTGYAKRIIKYRETVEKFEVPEDILKVPGIGEKKFLKIKDKISVE